MKEFEKWLYKYTHGELVSQRYELADAWRAALKWIQQKSANDCIYFSDVNSAIRKELQGKSE